MTGELQPGPTLADTTGQHRLQKLQERCQHIDEQIAELRDKKRLMQYEAWCIRAETTQSAFVWLYYRIIMQCYR